MKVNGIKNRRNGHTAERKLAKMFRDLGFDKCTTTRSSSRLLDSCGIDLDFIPVHVQSKAGKQTQLKPAGELKYITERLKEKLPKDSPYHGYTKAVIQLKPVGKGKKRTEFDDIVTMTLKDYLTLVKLAYIKEN
jgi:hypothetical protein